MKNSNSALADKVAQPDFQKEIIENILLMSKEGMVILNLDDLSIVMINKRMEEFFGGSSAEIIGVHPSEFLSDMQPNGQTSHQMLEEAIVKMKQGETVHQIIKIKNLQGKLLLVDSTHKCMNPPFSNYFISIGRDITKEQEDKIEAEKREEMYTFLFQNAFEGVVIYDIDKNRPIDCNQTILDYLGISKEWFMNSTPLDYSPKYQLDGQLTSEKLLMLNTEIKKTDKVHTSWSHKSSDGRQLESELSLMKMQAPHEHINICIFKDVTNQLAANRELKRNEADLIEAQHLAKMASFKYNITKDELVWSRFGYSLMELDPEIAPLNINYYLNLIHPNDRADFISVLAFAQESNRNFETEFRFISPNNSLIHIKFRAQFVADTQDQVFMGTAVDISTQKEIEQNLRDTSAKYIDLFNNMYDALVIVDAEGYMSDVNLAGQKMLGYTKKELAWIKIPSIVHPDDAELSLDYLEKLKTEGFYSGYEGRIIRKDGKVRYLQVNSNAILKEGQMVGSRDIARDITELKMAEERREKLLQQLGEANKELKDFAYIVSHDLKAPLRAISNISKWITEDYHECLDDKGMELLTMLNKRVDRMHNFIQAILDYSKITRTESNNETFSIQKLVEEVIENIDPSKHVNIIIQDKLPDFFGIKIRIEQIFQNLISNAIKYGNQNNGKINITYKEQEEYLEFGIRDNGPGIEAKYFEKIFQIFQTLQSRDHFESTGIGLSIVKRIVQLHEGKVWVTSSTDPTESFTEFHFTLKRKIKAIEHVAK